MGLDAPPRGAQSATLLANPRVRLAAALVASFLLGCWTTAGSSYAQELRCPAATAATVGSAPAPAAGADNLAQPIVDDAALEPVTEEDVEDAETAAAAAPPEPEAAPAAAAPAPAAAAAKAAAKAAAPPRRPAAARRKSVVKLRGALSCAELTALRSRFIAYLTVPDIVPGIRTAVMNIIGQLDAEVLLPLIGDLCVREREGGGGAIRRPQRQRVSCRCQRAR